MRAAGQSKPADEFVATMNHADEQAVPVAVNIFAGAITNMTVEDASDLDGYVTTQALDGLFKMVAVEEKQIRENPMAGTTDLLKKVFGTSQ